MASKRRKTRSRPVPLVLGDEIGTPYTMEGYIGGLGRFAVGARRARGAKQKVAVAMCLLLLIPLLLTVIGLLAFAILSLVTKTT